MKEICLGSAQFGTPYGITNKEGKVSQKEIKKIIIQAKKSGIKYIDTAMDYGRAQISLGQTGEMDKFNIITKLSHQRKSKYAREDETIWERELTESLKALRVKQINTLLIHNANDMKKDGCEHLQNWVEKEKKRGRVIYTGVSIYKKEDLSNMDMDMDHINIIQGPLSIYDQRLIEKKFVAKLQKKSIKLMVRSIYLQGLILQSEELWPKWISDEAKMKHKKFRSWLDDKELTAIQGVINYLKNQQEVDIVTVGTCKQEELNEFISNWRTADKNIKLNHEQWRIDDENIIDPRKWPKNENAK